MWIRIQEGKFLRKRTEKRKEISSYILYKNYSNLGHLFGFFNFWAIYCPFQLSRYRNFFSSNFVNLDPDPHITGKSCWILIRIERTAGSGFAKNKCESTALNNTFIRFSITTAQCVHYEDITEARTART